jgi:hypothetical protein
MKPPGPCDLHRSIGAITRFIGAVNRPGWAPDDESEANQRRTDNLIGSDPYGDARLPSAVLGLAARLGVKSSSNTTAVSLTQSGRMKAKLDAKSWMAFTARQSISTRTCAFDWRARAGPLGMVSGRDALENGEGRFDIMALGIIPIARAAHSAALVRGELMRYLAELPWAPDAIVLNTALRWREDGADKIIVGAGTGETAVDVVLSLDTEGRIAGAFAPDRPRSAVAPVLPTPWRGRFSDYRQHNGRWLPFAGEVGWEIEGRELIYWQARIERWQAIGDTR